MTPIVIDPAVGNPVEPKTKYFCSLDDAKRVAESLGSSGLVSPGPITIQIAPPASIGNVTNPLNNGDQAYEVIFTQNEIVNGPSTNNRDMNLPVYFNGIASTLLDLLNNYPNGTWKFIPEGPDPDQPEFNRWTGSISRS